MENLTDGIKKLLLAGIGAAAMTAEKSQELLDEMVRKGELTVEQGRELNKELKHNINHTIRNRKEADSGLEARVASMSAEELQALKEAIAKAEAKEEDPS